MADVSLPGFVSVPYVDGPLAGSSQNLPAEYAVDGADSWYPGELFGASQREKKELPVGERYVLRFVDKAPGFYHVAAIRLINREDVSNGLKVIEAVYTVAIILGFRSALQAAYPAIVHPFRTVHPHLSNPVILLALSTIMLLGLRFFWVTRNLYVMIIGQPEAESKRRIGRIVRYHFTITLFHAVLFFVLCDTFAALAELEPQMPAGGLANRFILGTVLLLGVNAAWLFACFTREEVDKSHERSHNNFIGCVKFCFRDESPLRWAGLNTVTCIFAIAWLHWSHLASRHPDGIIIGASAIFLLNSFLDLGTTADAYLLFPGSRRPLSR